MNWNKVADRLEKEADHTAELFKKHLARGNVKRDIVLSNCAILRSIANSIRAGIPEEEGDK